METFQAYYTDIHASGWQRHAAAQLREQGLVTFSGITERTGLIDIARQLMAIRPHRDAGPDGVTVITKTQDESSGFTGCAYLGAPLEPAGPGRTRIRLRLDDLA